MNNLIKRNRLELLPGWQSNYHSTADHLTATHHRDTLRHLARMYQRFQVGTPVSGDQLARERAKR